MDKRGDMPFWLVMTIIVLASMIVLIIIISAAGTRLQDFLGWLKGMF